MMHWYWNPLDAENLCEIKPVRAMGIATATNGPQRDEAHPRADRKRAPS
jgi:hypothetical protein